MNSTARFSINRIEARWKDWIHWNPAGCHSAWLSRGLRCRGPWCRLTGFAADSEGSWSEVGVVLEPQLLALVRIFKGRFDDGQASIAVSLRDVQGLDGAAGFVFLMQWFCKQWVWRVADKVPLLHGFCRRCPAGRTDRLALAVARGVTFCVPDC